MPKKTITKKQTSGRVSSIAGRVLRALGTWKANEEVLFDGGGPWITAGELRALAASCLSQDETPKARKQVRARTGKARSK